MMLVFWIIAFLLLLAILAIILPALVRAKVNEHNDLNTEKRLIFNQQFAELDQDKINGTLDAAQYTAAKAELERRVLEEVKNVRPLSAVARSDWRLAIILFFSIPLAAFVLYYQLGSPDSVLTPATSPDHSLQKSTSEHSTMMRDLEPLLVSLEKKLKNQPADGEGWALLARSYVELRQYVKSISAFQRATAIIGDDPQLLADYADALAVVNGHQLAGAPEALVDQALKLDPHHIKALMLAATAAFDRQAYNQAIGYWERALQVLPADSEVLSEVQASLHEAQLLSGEKVAKTKVESSENPSTNTGIYGTVSILPKLAKQLDPSTSVFIYARATQGPSMPLAIVRTTVAGLPYEYHLDDSTALVPNHKLSQAEKVLVIARVSKAGDAKQQSGDLQGVANDIGTDGKKVDIEISAVLP